MSTLAETTDTGFTPVPSLGRLASVAVAAKPNGTETVVGIPVASSGPVPDEFRMDRARLEAAGFDSSVGSALVVATSDLPTLVAVGVGEAGDLDVAALRNASAAFARAASSHAQLAIRVSGLSTVPPRLAAQAVVEGALLARYRYDPLRSSLTGTPLSALTVIAEPEHEQEAHEGAQRGRALASVTLLARDLANTPHSHLTATTLAGVAVDLAASRGLEVEVFDEAALVELRCGGLLGVNAGSVEPPRMVKLVYRPAGGAVGTRLTFVGKGLTYDSGGLALKPGDEVHAQMKNDMSGAAAVLAAMSALGDLGCPNTVTGYLMCTDNMPSGTAMAMGDVITIRGGTTVEVVNTDAEGRLVMADALVLATEEPVDAIVDIATLTGACMRALGTQVSGVIGNDQRLVEQVEAAAAATDEPVWQLPLDRRYRPELDSTTADLRNMGGVNAGAITAGLFLAEFVGDVPWAHIDIAGTAQTPADRLWHTAGCSGVGARLLAELAVGLTASTR